MTSKQKLRLGILASGGGTNLQSIIDQCDQGLLDADICLVISNNPGAGALERATQAGIKTACVDHRNFESREEFDQAVITTLNNAGVELVVLAGFMRIISAPFLQAFPQKIINIHPSLLPSFPGLHVQQKALDYGAKVSGCTVHFVDDGVDTGPIIVQAVVRYTLMILRRVLPLGSLNRSIKSIRKRFSGLLKGELKLLTGRSRLQTVTYLQQLSLIPLPLTPETEDHAPNTRQQLPPRPENTL